MMRMLGLPPQSFFRNISASYFSSKAAALSQLLPQTEQAADRSTPFRHHNDIGFEDEVVQMDWDNMGFNLNPVDYMYIMKCSKSHEDDDEDVRFIDAQLSRYGNLEISPAAGILNYGQGLLEGMKAFRREDGRIALFRPDQNALRLKMGAERMCMPCPSNDQFMEAVKQTTLANKRWIPPAGKGALYLRPLLLGTGPILGVAPTLEYSFLIYASPVGNYFKEGKTLNLYVESEYDRASRGGVGGIKSITNYAPGLKSMRRAKNKGFSDVLYLDSTRQYIEECSSSNIFVFKDKVISTPMTNNTILPGITRKSIIEIALDHGFEVKERLINVEELLDADEVFCTGTATVVASIDSITYKDERIVYQVNKRPIYKWLSSTLRGIQSGTIEDKKGWIVEI